MTSREIPILPNVRLETIVFHNIEFDQETAFKIALVSRKEMCAWSQNGIYPSTYASVIPKIHDCSVRYATERGTSSLLDWWWRCTELTSDLLRDESYDDLLWTINIETLQGWEDRNLIHTHRHLLLGCLDHHI
jgi:hypothetical protein